jgi:hypothetical protein
MDSPGRFLLAFVGGYCDGKTIDSASPDEQERERVMAWLDKGVEQGGQRCQEPLLETKHEQRQRPRASEPEPFPTALQHRPYAGRIVDVRCAKRLLA